MRSDIYCWINPSNEFPWFPVFYGQWFKKTEDINKMTTNTTKQNKFKLICTNNPYLRKIAIKYILVLGKILYFRSKECVFICDVSSIPFEIVFKHSISSSSYIRFRVTAWPANARGPINNGLRVVTTRICGNATQRLLLSTLSLWNCVKWAYTFYPRDRAACK